MDKMELRRAQQAAPTEPGFYYGRYRSVGPSIYPFEVARWTADNPNLFVRDGKAYRPTSAFDWFGPVPVCIEAQLPT